MSRTSAAVSCTVLAVGEKKGWYHLGVPGTARITNEGDTGKATRDSSAAAGSVTTTVSGTLIA